MLLLDIIDGGYAITVDAKAGALKARVTDDIGFPLASPLLALIYWARSRGVHLRLQVSFPNPRLLRTTGFRTFLVSRRLLRRCQLAGRGCIFMGLLSSGTPGRLICRSRGVTPSSVAPECLGDSKSRAGTRVHPFVSRLYAQYNRGSLAVWWP